MTDEIQPTTNPPPKEPPKPRDYFKDVVEARKALRQLQVPITEASKAAFAESIRKSPRARSIAFAILVDDLLGSQDVRLKAVRGLVRQVLVGECPCPNDTQIADAFDRRSWLATEFAVSPDLGAIQSFITDQRFLRPLYLLLAVPDSERWLDIALADFHRELKAAVDSAKPGEQKKGPTRSTAAPPRDEVLRLLSRTVANSAKPVPGLIAQLRMVRALTTMMSSRLSGYEAALKQADTLRSLLEQTEAEKQALAAELERANTRIAEEQREVARLRLEIEGSRDQMQLHKGVADARVHDELTRQRASIRSLLHPKVQNIRLYADRETPARDRILELCDEILAFLDAQSK